MDMNDKKSGSSDEAAAEAADDLGPDPVDPIEYSSDGSQSGIGINIPSLDLTAPPTPQRRKSNDETSSRMSPIEYLGDLKNATSLSAYHDHDDSMANEPAGTDDSSHVPEPENNEAEGEGIEEERCMDAGGEGLGEEKGESGGDEQASISSLRLLVDGIPTSEVETAEGDKRKSDEEKADDTVQDCQSLGRAENVEPSQTVIRQCPICLMQLHFRSERSAAGGFKMHVTRCGGKPTKEPRIPTKGPASPEAQPTRLAEMAEELFSLDPNTSDICRRDVTIVRQKRAFCQPPDPRPVFGCHWCGPSQNDVSDLANERLCPICKLFQDMGWFLWIQERANKKVYVDSNQRKYNSVREFLVQTTSMAGEMMERMSPDERSTLFEVKARDTIEPPKKKSRQSARTAANVTSTAHTPPSHIVRGISVPAFAKAIASKLEMNAARKSISSLSAHGRNMVALRRGYVQEPDPRPARGCKWCGVSELTQNNLDDAELCPICRSFEEFGWLGKIYPTYRHFFDTRDKPMKSVKNYLRGSTVIVCEAIKLLPQADCLALMQNYEDVQIRGDNAKNDFTPKGRKPPLPKKSSTLSGISDVSKKREEAEIAAEVPKSIELPTLSKLLEEEKGLSGVLCEDVFQVYNSFYGTNGNIAAKVLMCLTRG
ncbi:hypothetical protein ACHAWF_006573 [Thalassiosira exigua]